MTKKKSSIKYYNGFTRSAWKSLAIKSLRIGWVDGIDKAAENLPPSEMKNLLLGGLFEDVFPCDYEQLEFAYQLILKQDYYSLCSIETLHGKGLGQQFFDLRFDATNPDIAGKQVYGIIANIKKHTSIGWLNPRMNNCIWTWDKIDKDPNHKFRIPYKAKWKGMPKNILDGHTLEGKFMKQDVELLSGHYENHLAIANEVMANGWTPIREKFYNSEVTYGKSDRQTFLFI